MLKLKRVVLDLDQTLISAHATEDHDFKKYKQKSKKFEFYDMDGYYIVYERPGLQDFLDFLFNNFSVSIWTAASKDYAIFIIDKIILKKPGRKIDYVFFSYHCGLSKRKMKHSKDLRMLSDKFDIKDYSKDNTIILDDYDEVFNTQPKQCIIAIPFEFTQSGSENDNFLKKIQPLLLKMKDGSIKTEEINNKIKA